MTPDLQAVDHVHVYVADRPAAEAWYKNVLGLERVQKFEFWAEGGGPLMVENRSGTIRLALFERPAQPCRSVIAFRVGASQYMAWKSRLEAELKGQVTEQDHVASRSLYFADPDGNPYEITTYQIAEMTRLESVL